MHKVRNKSFGTFVQALASMLAPRDAKHTRKGQVTYIVKRDVAADVWGDVRRRDIR